MTQYESFCELGQAVIKTEAAAVTALSERIDDTFAKACHYMLNCRGRIIVTGMGKSGHIAGKIAATLASTGTPAFYVHPGEASHGDLGMITKEDVVLAISNSGETREILTILPLLKRLNVPLISLTGKPDSTIATSANANIDVSIAEEACPLGLAPTSSTTVTLVMGDALAIALLQIRGFTAEDFALSHPGGTLGKRLLLRIDDIIHINKKIPKVMLDASLSEALVEMTAKGLGMTGIVDTHDTLHGIFTDGDLRRTLDKELDFKKTPISAVMTKECKTIKLGTLAAEALKIMEDCKINALLVVDERQKVIGALNMHDLLHAGVI